MSLKNCPECGGEVRLSAMRITVNRRRGVAHAVVHRNGANGCRATDAFNCAALKPYPKQREETESYKLVQRWNANATEPADAQ